MSSKKCYKCGCEKPIEEFSKHKNRPGGVNAQCKSCHSKYRIARYKTNPELERGTSKEYKTKEQVPTECAYCGIKLIRFRTNVSTNTNNFCNAGCKGNYHTARRDYIGKYLRLSLRRAKTNGFEFNLTNEYLHDLFFNIQRETCAITGVPIKLLRSSEKGTLANSASLDRVDNDQGYIEGNVRFVCLGINYMKNRRSDIELNELLSLIQKNYKGNISVNG